MGLAPGTETLKITWAVALDDIIEFCPIDLSEVVMAGVLVPLQIAIRYRETEKICLGHGLVDEPLPELVVGQQFDFPPDRLRSMRRLRIGWAKHHERRPPPTVQGILGHTSLGRRSLRHHGHDLKALPLVKTLFFTDTDHRPGVRAVRTPAERYLIHDGRAVHQPADRADIRPREGRIIKDTGILRFPGKQISYQLIAADAQGFGGAIKIKTMAGFILDLGQQDRFPAQGRGPGDPVSLRQLTHDFRMRVLGNLADQGPALSFRHPIPRLDGVAGIDSGLERSQFRRSLIAVGLWGDHLCVHRGKDTNSPQRHRGRGENLHKSSLSQISVNSVSLW